MESGKNYFRSATMSPYFPAMARQQKSGVNGELIRFLFDRPGVRSKENNVLLSGNDLKTDVDGLLCRFNVLLFFFQAEDGIRDGRVTGVQTCALPIWSGPGGPFVRSARLAGRP